MRVSKQKIIIFSIIVLSIFFDMLTGTMIYAGILKEGSIGSPSQLFRLILTVILVVELRKYRYSKYILALPIIILCYESVQAIIHNSWYGYIIGIVYFAKIYFILLSSYYLMNVNDRYHEIIFRFFTFAITLIAANLYFTMLTGIGISTYGWGFGVKGFFASGNGLGILLGVGVMMIISQQKKWSSLRKLHLTFLISSIPLIGTKTSLLLCIFSLILFAFRAGLLRNIALFTVFILTYFREEILKIFNDIFDVILMRFQNSESLFLFMASGRFNYATDAWSKYINNDPNIMGIIFGQGIFISYRDPSGLLSLDILESDLADIFFAYGLLGFSILIISYVYLLTLAANAGLYIFMPTLLITLHSLLAGHVLFNALTGTVLAFVCFVIIRRPLHHSKQVEI